MQHVYITNLPDQNISGNNLTRIISRKSDTCITPRKGKDWIRAKQIDKKK